MSKQVLSRKDLAPRGAPPSLILAFYTIGYMGSGLFLQNILPTCELMKASGVLGATGMSETDIHDTIVNYLNLGLSISLLSTAIIQFIASYFGGLGLLSLLWLVAHSLGMYVLFSASSVPMLGLGVLLGSLAFPSSRLLFPAIYGMFPGNMFTVCALNACAGNISNGLASAITTFAAASGLSVKNATYMYIAAWAPIGICIWYFSPSWGSQTWMQYIPGIKYTKGLITWDQYQESMKPKEKGTGRAVEGFNPSIDPPYFGYSFPKFLMSPHLWIFMSFFLPHFLRVKKVINPFIDKILLAKGLEAGISREEIDLCTKIFYAAPVFGWIPSLVFGMLADNIGNLPCVQLTNMICTLGYVGLAYLPWSRPLMYFVASCYVINSGCCYGLGISYFTETYGPNLIASAIAFFLVSSGLCGLISDLLLPTVIANYFNNNHLTLAKLTAIVSIMSLASTTLLLVYKPPSPVNILELNEDIEIAAVEDKDE